MAVIVQSSAEQGTPVHARRDVRIGKRFAFDPVGNGVDVELPF